MKGGVDNEDNLAPRENADAKMRLAVFTTNVDRVQLWELSAHPGRSAKAFESWRTKEKRDRLRMEPRTKATVQRNFVPGIKGQFTKGYKK
jgi:hypothetical protein